MSPSAIVDVDLQGALPKVASGKVRDLYAVDEDTLLFVASDRISAYDVVMNNVRLLYLNSYSVLFTNEKNISGLTLDQGIPGKGALLTAMRYPTPLRMFALPY
jgi:phosphoribosylaminoimidazole-succinocarboxamide synthase